MQRRPVVDTSAFFSTRNFGRRTLFFFDQANTAFRCQAQEANRGVLSAWMWLSQGTRKKTKFCLVPVEFGCAVRHINGCNNFFLRKTKNRNSVEGSRLSQRKTLAVSDLENITWRLCGGCPREKQEDKINCTFV